MKIFKLSNFGRRALQFLTVSDSEYTSFEASTQTQELTLQLQALELLEMELPKSQTLKLIQSRKKILQSKILQLEDSI